MMRQLHLMSSAADPQARFWADCYGLAADERALLFAHDLAAEEGTKALHDRLRRELARARPEVLLVDLASPLYDHFLLGDLKREFGFCLVLVTGDDEFKFESITSSYAAVADLLLSTDRVAVDRCRQAGINAHFFVLPTRLPSPAPEKGPGAPARAASFVGRVADKPSRRAFLDFLKENGVSVACFGGGSPNEPGYRSREDMDALFRGSAVNLNFSGITTYMDKYNNALYHRIRGAKIRPLEILAAGGFCLSEHSLSLEATLEDGKEIALFRTKAELLEKLRHYLAHPEEARRIAENGARAVRERYAPEPVARRMRELIAEARGRGGRDLYGEPLADAVSRWAAESFVVCAASGAVALLFRGRAKAFLADLGLLARYIRRYRGHAGSRAGAALGLFAVYRLIRELGLNVRAQFDKTKRA